MKFGFAPTLDKRPEADLLVLPFWEGPAPAADCKGLDLQAALHDFKGKSGETLLFYGERGERILLLGLGAEATAEALRRAYASAARAAQAKKLKRVTLLFPKTKEKQALSAIAEGILLTNYMFSDYKKPSAPLIEQVNWIGIEEKALLERQKLIAEGVYFIRDWVNRNADDKMPKQLAQMAVGLAKGNSKLKTTVLDKKKIEEAKMGLLLAVNRASAHDPCVIVMSYKGDPKSKEHTVLVGKGITYDTGGLQIKPPDNMMTMKCDMAGCATVLGIVHTAAALGIKANVTAVAPVTENAIGSKSYKLGDVYRSYSGKTVEVNNTDAEGRLVLADAISYAIDHLKPTRIVDMATLTGSVVIGLGEGISGFFSNDEKMAKNFQLASEKSGELVWRLPLHAEYKEALKSDIADLLNTGGRDGGAIKAALFLQEFVGKMPWIHLDMAGPPYVTKPKHYNTTKGTGYGLRLMIEFLESL